jgi:hypothetical protein
VSTIEELLGRKSSGFGLESREYGRRDASCWPRGAFYPQTLTLTLPTSGCRSVGLVHSRTQATEFSLVYWNVCIMTLCESYYIDPSGHLGMQRRSLCTKYSNYLNKYSIWLKIFGYIRLCIITYEWNCRLHKSRSWMNTNMIPLEDSRAAVICKIQIFLPSTWPLLWSIPFHYNIVLRGATRQMCNATSHE